MKLRNLTPIAAAVLLSAFTTFSAAEKDLIGSWKMDDHSVAKMTTFTMNKVIEQNPAAESQIEEQKYAITDMMKGIRLNIKADHTYETITPQGPNAGKWALANKDRVIDFTRPDGTIRRDTILESSAARLKVINGQAKDTITYIHP